MPKPTTLVRRTGVLCLAATLLGCGSGYSQAANPPIAGTYAFTKRYIRNSCGADMTLVDQTASVTHDAAAGRFVFNDGVVAFRGRVSAAGAFVADTVSGQNAEGNTLVVVLSGQFHATGFDATLQVDQLPPSAAATQRCAYTIAWTGTRHEVPTMAGARSTDLGVTAPDGVRLAGTLHLPEGAGPFPTVMLVHGSEPGTRQHRGYQAYAEALIASGFATLVVDKRGTGESQGEYTEAPDLEVPAADFGAWLAVLKRQPQVRTDAIGMLGWSQAGWVAPLVASRHPEIAFLVLISGSGVSPLEQNIYDKTNQVVARAPNAAAAERARTAVRAVMSYEVTGQGRAEAATAWEAVSGEDWFTQGYTGIGFFDRADVLADARGRSFIVHNGYDPAPALRALRIPVLALFGEADRIVPVERSRQAMQAGLGDPSLFESRMIPGANHALAVRDAQGTTRLDPTVLPTITSWLTNRFGSGRAEPLPARIDSVAFRSGTITLRGVIHLPAGPPPYPAVFFLHGGGTQFLNSEPTDFARMLVAQGIAALVYDKRGNGTSGGDYLASTFDDFLADGQAAYRYLAGRDDIRAERVGVLGFSQGGRFAPILAATTPLAVAISVSGPAVPAAEQRLFALRNSMLEQGIPSATVDRALPLWQAQFEAIANGTPLSTLDARIAAAATDLPRGLLPPSSAEFTTNPILNSFRFNGDSLIRRLQVPFLALLGSADVVVPVEPTVASLRRLLGPDRPGAFEVVVLEGATHALDNPPGTRHPEYVPLVLAWMTRYLKAP